MQTEPFSITGLIFLIAGLVKGVSGMGLPTVAMALLGFTMPPAAAATLILLPSFLTNLVQCCGPHFQSLCRRLWPMWSGLVLCTIFSPLPDMGASEKYAKLILGIVLATYGVWGLFKPVLPDFRRHALPAGALAGILCGLLTAATGVFVIPLVPYLQSLKMGKEELIQALGLSFMMATLALAVRLAQTELNTPLFNVPSCVIALVAAFAGLWIGARLRNFIQPAHFQQALYAVLLVLGIAMLGRSL